MPSVKRNKYDAADAEAIREAVTRPSMRFVAIKTVVQQSILVPHRTSELPVRQRTGMVNAIRAHMAEFGIVARVSYAFVREVMPFGRHEHLESYFEGLRKAGLDIPGETPASD